MSWLDALPAPRLRRTSVFASLACALALGGCFRPMYGPGAAGGSSVQAELQAITVAPIPERIGHYLGNELIFRLNGTGDEVPARYTLRVTTHETVQTALIDTLQARATGATLVAVASYTLVPVGGGPPVTTGSATATADYDRSVQRFANVRAARDAEIRVAGTLADMIKTQVAATFAVRP